MPGPLCGEYGGFFRHVLDRYNIATGRLLGDREALCTDTCVFTPSGPFYLSWLHEPCDNSSVSDQISDLGDPGNAASSAASGYLLWKKDKNFWISYDGIVTLGIDSSKLDVKVDGENVKIHIPEAKVLSSKPNPDSITKDSYYYAKNSAIADADDQTKAYKKAEKEMEKTAANDTVLLAQAQQRVQSMLEDYVKNMGTMLGKEYTITWDIKENHVKPDTAESTE